MSPSAPIVLVGCQSDLRADREVLAALAKDGRAPVSSDQALSFSQQMGALMYVETSAKLSRKTPSTAFDVAAMAALGKLAPPKESSPRSTPSPKSSLKKQKFSSTPPANSLEREQGGQSAAHFWDKFNPAQSPALNRSSSEYPTVNKAASNANTGSLGSSRSARSSSSIPSISSLGSKTPKGSRKNSAKNQTNGGGERMITIKCQRLTADKTYEEIEVEVPAPIYDTIQLYNDASTAAGGVSSLASRNAKQRRSLGSKLKNLFSSAGGGCAGAGATKC